MLTKVFYKPDSQSTGEYSVIVDPVEYNKWKDDKSVPLVGVVHSFLVSYSGQGTQGILGKPSQQQLDTDFGSHNDVEVITLILEKGREQHGHGIASPSGISNLTRGTGAGVGAVKGSTGI